MAPTRTGCCHWLKPLDGAYQDRVQVVDKSLLMAPNRIECKSLVKPLKSVNRLDLRIASKALNITQKNRMRIADKALGYGST